MSRIPMIADGDGLAPDARAVFDRIVESRGGMLRPFEVLLHSPVAAERVAELGEVVKSGLGLTDADRELVTLATGRATGCAFVWDSHLEAARAAGLSSATIAILDTGGTDLPDRDAAIVAFVRELCEGGSVSGGTFRTVLELLGTTGVVEVSLVVGYYVMLGAVMGAVDAC